MEGTESNITITRDEQGNAYFVTPDTYLSAHLKDQGNEFELVTEDNTRFDCRFRVTDALLQAIYEYQSGIAVVNALQFSRSIKAVRGAILRKKEGQNGRNNGYARAR